jgi:hypothetical protein
MSKDSERMHLMWSEDELNQIQDLEAHEQTLQGNHFAHGSGFHKARMLREINEDDQTPKKHDFKTQNDLHERIRNDEDYDDWDYGTEAIYGPQNWS